MNVGRDPVPNDPNEPTQNPDKKPNPADQPKKHDMPNDKSKQP